MNQVRSANEIAKPRIGINATLAVKATQQMRARDTSFQRTSACFVRFSTALATSTSERTTIRAPYQTGKNPAPGPSSFMYTQPRACVTMYVPSDASARLDHIPPLRRNGFIEYLLVAPRGLPRLALVAPEGDQLRDRAARREELHRDHARIAHDLAAMLLDLLGGLAQILDLDREMM